jgi:hypothetical protein
VAAGPAPPSTASRVSRLVRLGRRFVAPDGGARHHWSGGREDECTRLESGRPVTGFVGSNPTRSAHLVGTVHSRSWLTGLAWADPHQRLPHRRGRRPAPSNYQGHDAVAAWQHATRRPRGRDRSTESTRSNGSNHLRPERRRPRSATKATRIARPPRRRGGSGSARHPVPRRVAFPDALLRAGQGADAMGGCPVSIDQR